MADAADRASLPPVTIVAQDVGPVGGMEQQLSELIRGLLARGTDVTLISRTCHLEPRKGLHWVRVPGPARPFVLAFPWFFVVGSLLTRRHKRGVLHTTGAIVANRADICTVHFCHRATRGVARPLRRTLLYRVNSAAAAPIKRVAEWFVFQPARTRRFVAVSRSLARELTEHYPRIAGRVVEIWNGVDTVRFRPDTAGRQAVREELGLSGSEFVALFVGGVWDRKGLDVVLSALVRADETHLLVVGSGDVPRYTDIATTAGVASRVIFVGPRKDPERYFAAADVFVLPSTYETFSLAAHEAAAAGLPLLATRVHGVDELLQDGENGWFVDRDAAMLSERLRDLRDHVDRRREFGEAARRASKRYAWSRMVDAYTDIYRELAA